MKELSLNVLDITENSVKAKATLVEITITEGADTLELSVKDNGTGMTEEVLKSVRDPFYTTRTTRKVGMGIPLLQFAAEQTGGRISIESRHIDTYPAEHGTEVYALFYKNHIDFTPLGDIVSTIVTLIQGHPSTDFLFVHEHRERTVRLDTREVREVLGDDIPLDTFEILVWIRENLTEQYSEVQ